MNRIQSLRFAGAAIVIILIVSQFFYGLNKSQNLLEDELANQYKPLSKRTRMDLAMEQEVERTKDPQLGIVPRNRLIQAYKTAQRKRSLNQKLGGNTKTAIAGIDWIERGPSNVGGRTRAIMIDPNDPTNKTVWAAGVGGGLWKTTDITKENPDWVSVDDFFDNMAITAIAYDPSDTDIMYFGTGEGFFNVDAIEGNGIWKSTDGGDTWSQLSSTVTTNTSTCAGTGDCNFLFVNKIVVTSGGAILAATRSRYTNYGGGLMRSTNGGSSWTKVLTGLSGTNACTGNTYRSRASDIEIASNGDIYVSFGLFENQGIWKSTDNGATWGSPIYTSSCAEQRIELAVAPSDANYVYALVQENDNTIYKIMRTTDAGTSWDSLANPSWLDQDCGAPSDDFTRNQAWYDLIAAVDPNDRETIYIGGIDLHRSTNGGSNWTQLTNWAGRCTLPEVHADQHAILYQPGSSDTIYFGNDGGIYYTPDGSETEPTFIRKEFGYNTSQFYSIAMHPTANSTNFIGGTQDNGSHKLTDLGISTMVEVTGGDGGFAHIDQDQPDFQFTAFTGLSINKSTDGGLTFSNDISLNNGVFINPTDYADGDNNIYGALVGGQYFFSSDIQNASPNFLSSGNITEFDDGEITAVTASPNTSNRVWFGLDNGRVVRVDNAVSTINPTNITDGSFPSGSVSCIAVESGDDNHLLVTYFNYGVVSIWETTDGGSNWTAVEGNLPDMPVRWALFNPNNSDQAIIATELGVWSTDNLDGGSTDWDPSNTGLSNARTDMLQIRSSDDLVVAATHGRGVFTSDVFAAVDADFTSDKNTIYAEAPVQFSDASYQATSWEWDFGDGGVSTDQNPSHTYKRAGKYEVTLTINGGANSETKSDFIHVLPNIAVPFAVSDGGNFETNVDYFGSDDLTGGINLWERGAPGNAITTVNSGTNAWKTTLSSDITQADYSCALFSPNFNFSAAGTYTLSFRKSMEVQFANAPMGVHVQYSTDNGQNWSRLGTDNDSNGTNWYERGPSSSFSIATNVIHDRMGFNDNFTNENTTYDVSFLSGNPTVAFRFVLYVNSGYSDSGYQRDGFMVDDFVISGPSNAANVNITSEDRGTVVSMDGTDDYITLSNLAANESFTAEMWLSPTVTGDGQTFLAKHDASGNDIFKIAYNNGGIEVTVRSQSTSGGTQTTGLQHLAVSVDKVTGSTTEITVYRNGEQLFQNTISDVIGSTDGLDWVIGQDWDGVGTPSDFFAGTIEELRLWNVVRTQNEIRQNNFLIVDGLDTNLIGYWQFNESTGAATENVITSNMGTLNGATWSSSSAPVGKGESNFATISGDGSTAFGSGLSINFSGVSGSFDVVVFEVDNIPGGTLPGEEYTLNEAINNPFTVINTFGSGTFTSASLTYTYGSGVFTESDPANVFLFKRPSTSSASWSDVTAATTVNPGTGVATFDNITSFSQTVIGTGDAVLPVELNNFNASRNQYITSLSWETLSELNNDKFQVQSSANGTIWSTIGEVSSKAENGNSNIKLSYSFEDKNVYSGENIYYRLKQIDFDGTTGLSDVLVVSNHTLTTFELSISPNPTVDLLNIHTSSSDSDQTKIHVLNLNGQLVMQKDLMIEKGSSSYSIDVEDLTNGLYILKIDGHHVDRTIRFLVRK